MRDKQAVPEALVEALVEFLVHEEGLTKLEEHHIPELHEIVDRTCVRFNGQKHNGDMPTGAGEGETPDPMKIRLHDDILKSVEQELFKLVQAKSASVV
jgi:hypothetical protein